MISETFDFYKRLFRQLAILVGIVLLPGVLVAAIVLSAVWLPELRDFHEVVRHGSDTAVYVGPPARDFVWKFVVTGFVLLAFGLLELAAQCAMTVLVGQDYVGGRAGWRSALVVVASRARQILATAVVFVLGFAVVFAGLVVCIVAGAVSPAIALLLAIGLTVATAWLFISVSVAFPVVLFESRSGLVALTRSFRLVRRRWWPTFGAYIGTVLIVELINDLVGSLTKFADGAPTFAVIALVTIGLAAQQLLSPLPTITLAFCYFDLRNRRDGTDIAEVAGNVHVEPGPTASFTPDSGWAPPPPTGGWGRNVPPPAPPAWHPPPPPLPTPVGPAWSNPRPTGGAQLWPAVSPKPPPPRSGPAPSPASGESSDG